MIGYTTAIDAMKSAIWMTQVIVEVADFTPIQAKYKTPDNSANAAMVRAGPNLPPRGRTVNLPGIVEELRMTKT